MINQKTIEVDSVAFGAGVRIPADKVEIIGVVSDENLLIRVYPWDDETGIEIIVSNSIEDIKKKLEAVKDEKYIPFEKPTVSSPELGAGVVRETQKIISGVTKVLELNKKLTEENKKLKDELERLTRPVSEKSIPITELSAEFVKELRALVESHKLYGEME